MPYKRTNIEGRAFVAALNARTVCAHCGGQPVEWHNPEHVELQRKMFRVSNLVASRFPISKIQAEIDRCTPLCRRCHMREDGRLRAFVLLARSRKIQPPKPCTTCGRPSKPLRRGLCSRCETRIRRARKAGICP